LVRFLVRYFLQMGSGSSKTVSTPTLELNPTEESTLSKLATISLSEAQAREAELSSQVESTRQQAEAKLGELGSQLTGVVGTLGIWKTVFWILFAILIVFGLIFGYDYWAISNGKTPILLPAPPQAPASPPGGGDTATTPPKMASPSPFSRLTSYLTGSDSSGDLASSLHDATTSMTIPATSAPLSSQTQGAYGVQWWMFVKDWNYGYGKDKAVLVRPDPTNPAVMNPSISLHPTDNTLKVSISVFPTDTSASKTEPAPATGSGASTDDVFICEVPNIPLQTWFSVSVSVFGKNADIYIDGKLVKSCMLPGVPKPAIGDIQVAPNGGFSGYMCNVYHYARMLTPSDAMTFYSAGSSCSTDVSSAGVTSSGLSGYSVKFGVYDTLGKQIQQYTF
jgi:hypothetical protein